MEREDVCILSYLQLVLQLLNSSALSKKAGGGLLRPHYPHTQLTPSIDFGLCWLLAGLTVAFRVYASLPFSVLKRKVQNSEGRAHSVCSPPSMPRKALQFLDELSSMGEADSKEGLGRLMLGTADSTRPFEPQNWLKDASVRGLTQKSPGLGLRQSALFPTPPVLPQVTYKGRLRGFKWPIMD